MNNSCANAQGLAIAIHPEIEREAPIMGRTPKMTAIHKARISEKCPSSGIIILLLPYFLFVKCYGFKRICLECDRGYFIDKYAHHVLTSRRHDYHEDHDASSV